MMRLMSMALAAMLAAGTAAAQTGDAPGRTGRSG